MVNGDSFSILIVDDDAAVVRILRNILAEFSPLRFATSGADALKLARQSPPDLILLDIEMPGLNGFEVCKALKSDATLAHVPIIFVTSHESVELEEMGLKLGAVDFVTKPPHAPLVLARVRAQRKVADLADTLRNAVTMDFLTGTANRLKFEKTLRQEWARSQRSATPIAVLLVSPDGAGHGDQDDDERALDSGMRSIAAALESVMHRPADLLARFSANTFALLLPETDSAGAVTVARRTLDAVVAARAHAESAATHGPLTVSVGGGFRKARPAIANRDALRPSIVARATPEDLIAAAEQALSAAQTGGGNRARYVDIASLGLANAVLVSP